MANGGINRLIATQQAPNLLGAIQQGQQIGQGFQKQNAQNRLLQMQQAGATPQDLAQAGFAAQGLQAQKIEAGTQAAELAEQQKDVKNALAATAGATTIEDFNQRIMNSTLLDDEDKQQAIELGPQGLAKLGEQFGAKGVQFGGQQTFKDTKGNLFFGTTKRNTQTGQVESVLAPISGDAQPVGQVSLVSPLGQTVAEKLKTDVQTASATETAKETAKLTAQYKLKPQVEAAVSMAIGKAKADIDIAGENRSNSIALNMYDTATTGLVSALSGTETGPVVGFLPAVTANQQIAEGAVAAMAPILKQLFRGANEGTFTDKDQDLLLQMLPTRKDRPDARAAKLANIDAIVRAKLSSSGPTADTIQAVPTVLDAPQVQDLGQFSLEQLIQMRNQAKQ